MATLYVGSDKTYKTINDAINAASTTEDTTIVISAGTYDEDIDLDVNKIEQKGNLTFAAAEGDEGKVVLTGTCTLGYRKSGEGNAKKWNAAVNFEGITFKCDTTDDLSVKCYYIKQFSFDSCTFIGAGYYVFDCETGGITDGPNKITNCVFEDARIQTKSLFSNGLEIVGCKFFGGSRINVRNWGAGYEPVTVKDCTFDLTVTGEGENQLDGFYAVRNSSEGTAVEIINSTFAVKLAEGVEVPDTFEEVPALIVQRDTAGADAVKWTMDNVEVNFADSAEEVIKLNSPETSAASPLQIVNLSSTDNTVEGLLKNSSGIVNVHETNSKGDVLYSTTYSEGEKGKTEVIKGCLIVDKSITAADGATVEINGVEYTVGVNAFKTVKAALTAIKNATDDDGVNYTILLDGTFEEDVTLEPNFNRNIVFSTVEGAEKKATIIGMVNLGYDFTKDKNQQGITNKGNYEFNNIVFAAEAGTAEKTTTAVKIGAIHGTTGSNKFSGCDFLVVKKDEDGKWQVVETYTENTTLVDVPTSNSGCHRTTFVDCTFSDAKLSFMRGDSTESGKCEFSECTFTDAMVNSSSGNGWYFTNCKFSLDVSEFTVQNNDGKNIYMVQYTTSNATPEKPFENCKFKLTNTGNVDLGDAAKGQFRDAIIIQSRSSDTEKYKIDTNAVAAKGMDLSGVDFAGFDGVDGVGAVANILYNAKNIIDHDDNKVFEYATSYTEDRCALDLDGVTVDGKDVTPQFILDKTAGSANYDGYSIVDGVVADGTLVKEDSWLTEIYDEISDTEVLYVDNSFSSCKDGDKVVIYGKIYTVGINAFASVDDAVAVAADDAAVRNIVAIPGKDATLHLDVFNKNEDVLTIDMGNNKLSFDENGGYIFNGSSDLTGAVGAEIGFIGTELTIGENVVVKADVLWANDNTRNIDGTLYVNGVYVRDNNVNVAGTLNVADNFVVIDSSGTAKTTIEEGGEFTAKNVYVKKESYNFDVNGTANVSDFNSEGTVYVGTKGTLNLTGKSDIAVLNNSGEFTVSGDSTLKIDEFSGNAIEVTGGTLTDSTVNGGIIAFTGDTYLKGSNEFSCFWVSGGTLTVEGELITKKPYPAFFAVGDDSKVSVTEKTYFGGFNGTEAGHLVINGTYTAEEGVVSGQGKLTVNGKMTAPCLYLRGGETIVNKGGELSGIVWGSVDAGASLTVDGGKFATKIGDFWGTLSIGGDLKVTKNGLVEHGGNVINTGTISIDATSSFIANSFIDSTGSIVIDAGNFVSTRKLVDVAFDSIADNKVSVINKAEGSKADKLIFNNDLYITDVTQDTLYVASEYSSKPAGTVLDDGNIIGFNAFGTFAAALEAAGDGVTIKLQEGSTADEVNTEIEFSGKDITITGNAPAHALPVVTFRDAVVDIKDAHILIPELDARENAVINVIDSIVDDAGGNGIVKSYFNGAVNITEGSTVYTMQTTTMGYVTIDNSTLNATWQTNVYGNGLITVSNGGVFNTAALHLTGKDYNNRDNTEEERVGKPAQITVDKSKFVVGKVFANNGADYSYNSSEGMNIGTVDGKKAIFEALNGATVEFWGANGEAVNIGTDGTVNIAGSSFSVGCRQDGGTVTLKNAGTINVSGESALNGGVVDGAVQAISFTGSGELVFDNTVLDSDIAASGNQTVRFTGVSKITDSSKFDVTGLNIVGTMQTVKETEEQLENVAASTLTISKNYTAQALWVGAQYNGKQDDKIANLIVSGEGTLLYVGADGDGDNRGLNIRESGAVTVKDKAQLTVNKDDAFVVKGALNIESGASVEALSSGVQIYAGGTVTVDGGTFTIGAYNDDNVCIGSVEEVYNDQNVLVDANAVSTGSIELKNGGKLILNETLNVLNGSITMNHLSTVKYAETIILDKYSEFNDINGSFIIDTKDYKAGTYLLMDYTGDGDTSVDYKKLLDDSWNDNFMVFNNDLYVTDAKQTTLYVNSKYTSADIALKDGRILGYNAFASVSAALTVANDNGGAEIEISTVKDEVNNELKDDGSTGVRINKSGTYTISGGSYKSLPAIWLGEGSKKLGITAELKILNAKVAVGKLGDEVDSSSTFKLTVENSVIDAVQYQWDGHNAGWMTFKNTDVTITNSYVNAQIEKDADVATFPRSAENVAAAVKAGTYKYLSAHDGYNGNATGILKSMTIKDSTYVSGFFTVRDRGEVSIDNSVLYVGGGLQLGYHNNNGNESWSGDRTSPENFRVGKAATMNITGSIIRYTGHGDGNADTGLMVGGKDANGGVLNITNSDFSMVAVGYTGAGDDATVAADSSINITNSEFTVDTLTNKGTVTVKGNSNAYINSVTGGITFGSAEKESIIGGVIGAKDESDMVSNSGKVYISDGSTVTLKGELATDGTIHNSVYDYADGMSKGYNLTIAEGADIRAGAIYISGGSEMTVAAGGKFGAFFTNANGFRDGTLNVYGGTLNVEKDAEVTTVTNNITGDLDIKGKYTATGINIYTSREGKRSGKVTVSGEGAVLDMTSNGTLKVGGSTVLDDKKYAAAAADEWKKAELVISDNAVVKVANALTNFNSEGRLYVYGNGIVTITGATLQAGYGIENYGSITVTDGIIESWKCDATANIPTVINSYYEDAVFTVAGASRITVDAFNGNMDVAGTSTITIGDFEGTMAFAKGAVLADESVITFSGDNDKVTAAGDLALLWNKNISGVETWDITGKLNISGVELPYGEDKVTLVDGTGLAADKLTINGSNIVDGKIVSNGKVYEVVKEVVDTKSVWSIKQYVAPTPGPGEDPVEPAYTPMTLFAGVVQGKNADADGKYTFTIDAHAENGTGTYSYKYFVNGKEITGNIFTAAYSDENLIVKVVAADAFGASTEVSSNIKVTVEDYTDPVLTLNTNGYVSGAWSQEAVTLNASATDIDNNGAKVMFSTDKGSSWAEFDGSVTLSDGEYEYWFKALDNANHESAVEKVNVKVDKVAPTLEITGNATEWTNKDVTLTATASDGKVEYFNGTKWVEGNIFAVTENGTYQFRVTDAAGNVTEKSVTVDKIDKDAPVLSVSSGEYAGGWTGNDVVLTASATDATLASVKYTVDGGNTWNDYTGDITLSESGEYTYKFKAVDAFGNETVSEEVSVMIDKAAPELTVETNGYDGSWTNKAVTLNAAASDDNTYSIEYSIDGGNTWTAGSDVVVNTNGSFEYMFRVTDAAGKTGDEKTVKVNYDDVPAVLTVTGNPADWIEITDSAWPVKLSASVNEAGCIIEYNDYGNRWEKYDAAQGVIVYKNGTVNFKVTDKAGNVTEQTVEVSKIWSDTNNDAPDTPDVPGEEFDGTVNVDKKLDIKESSTKYANVAVEMSTGNTTVNIGSGKVSSAGGVGTLAVEIGSISKADGAAGVNNVRIGKYADVKIHGTIEELGKLSTGKYTALDVDDTITGTAARQTISTGSGNNVDFADIDLKGGNDTLKIGADNSVSAGDIRNVEKISVGSRSDVNAGMITGVNKLSTSKGTAADRNEFGADGISGLLGKNDTVSFGNYNDVKLDYKVDLLSGKDTLKIGKESRFDAPEVSNVEIIKTGAGTRFLAETVNGVNKFTASGSKTSSGYIDITDLAGTAGNDTVSLGNYNDAFIETVNLGAGKDQLKLGSNSELVADVIDFGAGNDQLKLGSNSELSVDVIDFGAGNDTLSIGKNSVVSVTEIKGMETLKGSKGSTLEINNGADTDVKFDSTLKGSWNKVTVLDDAGELALGDNGINVYANEWDVFEFASPESGKLTLESSDAVKFEYRFSGADNWLIYNEGSAIALNGDELSIRVSVDLEDKKDKFAKFSASFKAELA